jgi:alpha-methylacyl-CoA racemase
MGPLHGVRVIELAGGAPSAFAATLLADLGADVVRIDRPSASGAQSADPLGRNRRSVTANIKDVDGLGIVRALIERADVFLDGMRPGGCERLGIGPDCFSESNPRLVFGRISGWGQSGPWAQRPGHDISFLAMAGLLDGDRAEGEPPTPPSTYLSTFAGGGLLLALGVLAALHEREGSGRGQVVDAAMIDGSAMLDVMIRQWRNVPGMVTVTDAPFYGTYACQDGLHVAVGAIEPRFYGVLVEQLGLAADGLPDRADEANWPALRACIAKAFKARPRDYWLKVFGEYEACVVPVLNPAEAAAHPALRARETFVEVAGRPQPAPAPRFGRTPAGPVRPSPVPGSHTDEVLVEWGLRG